MIFCEDCRKRKNWIKSPGFPYTGTQENSRCSLCGFSGSCHDIPGSILEPPEDREGKLALKIMLEAYRDKAENLAICNISGAEAGKANHRETVELKKILVKKNNEIDWYTTYHLRLAAQRGYEKQQKIKRDRRQYAI